MENVFPNYNEFALEAMHFYTFTTRFGPIILPKRL